MGKHRLVPHLIVNGGLDAIGFYERAFGAEKAGVVMAKDGKRVLHAELEVNGGAFKLSDSFPEMPGDMAAPGAAGGARLRIHSGAPATGACAIHLVISGLFTRHIRRKTQMSTKLSTRVANRRLSNGDIRDG